MKVSEAKYGRKINLGNYESEDYAITAIVEDGETASEVFGQLKEEIQSAISGEKTEGEEDVKGRTAGKSGKRKSESDVSDERPDEDEEVEGENEEDKADEGEEETLGDSGEEEADEGNEEEDSDESEDSPRAGKEKKQGKKSPPSTAGSKAKEEVKGKKFKKKPQIYQRSNETHKELFSGILRAVAPEWKKTDKTKALAKDASVKMEGVDFLDEEGNVLDSFKQTVKKHMSGKKK